ncbi:MAG: metal ABC transporter permease [Bacteroidota bacterium]|nr:metal ABC transporter permease [Bacteroidota bacterium]
MNALEFAFMQRALVEAILIGGVCGIIGVYVVLNDMSFIGAGISHSAFAGVALGLSTGLNPTWTAMAFSILVALGIGYVGERTGLTRDTTVGIFFAGTMALGVLLVGFLHNEYVDVFGYLFGNILAVTNGDIALGAGTAALILLTVASLFKEFLALSFDAEHARVTGIPTRGLTYLLLALVAVTVVVSVKSVGILLVSALLVIPAAAARQIGKRFGTVLALSCIFGIGSSVTGLLLAFRLDIPASAAIVLVSALLFFVSWTYSDLRKRTRREKEACGAVPQAFGDRRDVSGR